jgi:mono/diheme cytochrome c family protein
VLKLAVVFVAACLPGPDVGPVQNSGDASFATGDAPPGCDTDSDPNTAVSYNASLVMGVFQRGRCVMCHTGGGEGTAQSGLDLSSYANLRAGGQHSGTAIVVDGQPCASVLYQKITATPPFGRRMPYNGPPYLSDADIQLVHDWIAEGASDN